MNSFDILKTVKTMLVALLFFSPVFIWFALAIAGVTGDSGGQERFDHISGMIMAGCAALFLLIAVPIVIPRIWNAELPKRSLLKKGRKARGYIVKIGEGNVPVNESRMSVLLQIEIEEKGGSYLTAPARMDVPTGVLSLLRPGMELPLRINPGNRYSFVVDWDGFSPKDP